VGFDLVAYFVDVGEEGEVVGLDGDQVCDGVKGFELVDNVG